MRLYDPSDWYWFIGADKTQVFSSKRNASFAVSDATYQAWLAAGAQPTSIDTLTSLQEVLTNAGVPPYAAVTPRQARLALLAAGLLDQVEAAVAAADQATQITWATASEILRTDPLIVSIGTGLGLTQAQIDALFVAAAGL